MLMIKNSLQEVKFVIPVKSRYLRDECFNVIYNCCLSCLPFEFPSDPWLSLFLYLEDCPVLPQTFSLIPTTRDDYCRSFISQS